MRDSFFYLKLRAFLTDCRLRYRYARNGCRRRWRAACEARARLRDLYEQRQVSSFRLEALEARLLLAADLAGAANAAQVVMEPAVHAENGNMAAVFGKQMDIVATALSKVKETPTVSVSDAIIKEGNGGVDFAVFTVSLSSPTW